MQKRVSAELHSMMPTIEWKQKASENEEDDADRNKNE